MTFEWPEMPLNLNAPIPQTSIGTLMVPNGFPCTEPGVHTGFASAVICNFSKAWQYAAQHMQMVDASLHSCAGTATHPVASCRAKRVLYTSGERQVSVRASVHPVLCLLHAWC